MSDMKEILRLLASNDPDAIREGAYLASELNNEEAVPALSEHLASSNIAVQEAVDYALRKIGGPLTVQAVIPSLRSEKVPERNLAMDLLRAHGASDIPALRDLLYDNDTDIRIFVSDILGSVKQEQVVSLLCNVLLHDTEVNVRYQAAVSLGEVGFSSAAPCLNQALADEEWVQFAVIEALAKIRDESSISYLLKALDKCSDLIASTAIDALGEMGNIKAVPILLKRLDTSPSALCNKIVKAVVSILGEKSLLLLSERDQNKITGYMATALKDEDKSIQDASIKGIVTLNAVHLVRDILDLAAEIDQEKDPERVHFIVSSLASCGMHEGLEEAIRTGSQSVRRVTLAVIEKISDPSVCDLLTSIFWDSSPELQRIICATAAGCAAKKHQQFFLDVLNRHTDGTVLQAALSFLGKKGQADEVESSVMHMLEHPNNEVKESALEACISIDTPAIRKYFFLTAKDGDPVNRLMAVYALGHFDSDLYLSPLRDALLDCDEYVVRTAIEAVGRKKPLSAERLDLAAEMLHHDMATARMAAVTVLSGCLEPRVADLLFACLDDTDPWVVVGSIEALAGNNSSQMLLHLVRLVHHENHLIVFKAIEVLGVIGGETAFRALLELLESPDREVQEAAEAAVEALRQQAGDINV